MNKPTKKPLRKRLQTITANPDSIEGKYKQRVRRLKVFQMRMMNCTVREMAAELRAGTNTIIADLKDIDAALAKTIDRGQANAILNEKLSEFEALMGLALKGVKESSGSVQIGYLNTVLKIESLAIRLLQDAGVLPRADGTPFTLPNAAAPTTVVVNVRRDEESDAAVKLFGERPKDRT
jgi:hypothetical protein